jgi:hypothetical protein
MKQSLTALILLLSIALAGCGSNGNSANINGNWSATLTDSGGGATVFNFVTALAVNSDGSLSVVNFTFNSSGPCFVSGQSATGSVTLSGNFNGNVTGSFQLNVQSTGSLNSVLTLNGTVSGGVITGTWTLTGGIGCTGNGAFTMTRG